MRKARSTGMEAATAQEEARVEVADMEMATTSMTDVRISQTFSVIALYLGTCNGVCSTA
jgi:hypothetical protein